MELLARHRALIYKICYMYATDGEHLNDLYQEVLVNVWQGLDTYRGEAAEKTWIYRMAINTCVTYFRRTRRHSQGRVGLDEAYSLAGDDSAAEHLSQLQTMYRLIGGLPAMDKALILMWLDEKSYDEIADLSGLTRSNVATRLRRIKQKLVNSSSG